MRHLCIACRRTFPCRHERVDGECWLQTRVPFCQGCDEDRWYALHTRHQRLAPREELFPGHYHCQCGLISPLELNCVCGAIPPRMVVCVGCGLTRKMVQTRRFTCRACIVGHPVAVQAPCRCSVCIGRVRLDDAHV